MSRLTRAFSSQIRRLPMAAMLLLAGTAAQAQTAATDLAQISVTPIDHQAGAPAAWQTICDYSGGSVLPPGTRITTEGKWSDPIARFDPAGVTFSFPALAEEPQNAQLLKIGFAYERPLANYPTRLTLSYTSFFDQATSKGWSPFLITPANGVPLFGKLTREPEAADDKGRRHTAGAAAMPFNLVGKNTLVFTFDNAGNNSIAMNGRDATGFFTGDKRDLSRRFKPGAMLLPGIALENSLMQFPPNKGDWFAVNAFKLEQQRPPLEVSAVAAVDLTVTGSEPARITIEVVDSQNDSRGYVLRDAVVSPGKYRLYWDGIEQTQRGRENTPWIGAGSYTFRLTSSKTTLHYAGEINNSVPKGNSVSYQMINCTALAMTPPGTPPMPSLRYPKWHAVNNAHDTRKLDATDSVQGLGVDYDKAKGLWIGADGTAINCQTGITPMQHGRSIAMTPPGPATAADAGNQFYFVSQNMHGGNAIISCAFPGQGEGNAKGTEKILSNPDWNRTRPGYVPYNIQIGQFPDLLGQQHYLFFRTSPTEAGEDLEGEWLFRNIRFYEEGSPDPGPMVFDAAKFSRRTPKAPSPVPPGIVMVEDQGHSVHLKLKNAFSVNYPLNYTITEKTIMAFDLVVVSKRHVGPASGVGLSPVDRGGIKEDAGQYFNFLGGKGGGGDPRYGFSSPALGAYPYPTYQPNTLYTDSIPMPPPGLPRGADTGFLWQPGFYGLKISEDGKFLFACNNADNRLEVRDISRDGRAVAKIAVDYPMFVTFAPAGAAGAAAGTRYVYVDSPKAGLLRIAWNLADNTFGPPETLTPASEFAYPRGLTYSAATGRLFVCDTYNVDRSKAANQIAVIDPASGKVLSRFGKPGGVDPQTGGHIDEGVFTCPLTIDADSKGAIWVNDYFSCEMRKYRFDPASNGFSFERRVLGADMTAVSHFYWMPGAPPTQIWTFGGSFVRNEADLDADGRFTNQRATSTAPRLSKDFLRPYAHFSQVGDHIYATFANQAMVYEQVGDAWVPRFAFGSSTVGKRGETAGDAARKADLLARPGEPPTELDKAIAASGDVNWESRPWVWSDLNGDGKMEYSAGNPEFKIAFGSDLFVDPKPSSVFRTSDGAYVRPTNEGKTGQSQILVLTPKTINGKISYDWSNAKVIRCTKGEPMSDVLAQDGRYYAMRSSRNLGENSTSSLECYDEVGKLLWTRERDKNDLLTLQPLGDGMISIMDRAWAVDGPVMIRTQDGDLVTRVDCRDNADCWGHGALRSDADTGYIGLVQAYKVTGLSTVKSAAVTLKLSAAGRL